MKYNVLIFFLSICLVISNLTLADPNTTKDSGSYNITNEEDLKSLELKAKNGDSSAQIAMMNYHATLGTGGEGMKPYFISLFNNNKTKEYALSLLLEYFDNFYKYHKQHDASIDEFISIIQSSYNKNNDSIIGQYLACLECVNDEPSKSLELFKKFNDIKPAMLELYGKCIINYTDKNIQEQGLAYLQQAANKGSTSSLASIGMFNFKAGKRKEGIADLNKAAELGNEEANGILTIIYSTDSELKNEDMAKQYANKVFAKKGLEIVSVKIKEAEAPLGKYLEIKYNNGEIRMISVTGV